MTKANGQDDQGEVTGNRYGISKVSRAPEWEPFAQSELGTMGKLITEMHKMTMLAYGHLFEERDRLKHELTVFSKEHKGTRIAIGKKLEKVRSLIREIPNVTSKYQIILKGEHAFCRFMGWAIASGWNHSNKPIARLIFEFRKEYLSTNSLIPPAEYLWGDKEWMESISHYSFYESNPIQVCHL